MHHREDEMRMMHGALRKGEPGPMRWAAEGATPWRTVPNAEAFVLCPCGQFVDNRDQAAHYRVPGRCTRRCRWCGEPFDWTRGRDVWCQSCGAPYATYGPAQPPSEDIAWSHHRNDDLLAAQGILSLARDGLSGLGSLGGGRESPSPRMARRDPRDHMPGPYAALNHHLPTVHHMAEARRRDDDGPPLHPSGEGPPRKKKKTKFLQATAERRGRRCRRCGMPGDREPYKAWHQRTKTGLDIVHEPLEERCSVPHNARVPGFPLQEGVKFPQYNEHFFAIVVDGQLVRNTDNAPLPPQAPAIPPSSPPRP